MPDRMPPFAAFSGRPPDIDPLRRAITRACRLPEPEAVAALLDEATLAPPQQAAAGALATRLAQALRQRRPGLDRAGLVQGLLHEYALSSQEGVALMCLAEALLRIPDDATRDALIRDKVAHGDWQRHLGQSPSLFVNAATWGLLLTGRLASTHSEAGLGAAVARLVARGGEPLVRRGVDLAMRLLGEQFVTGETIDEALARAAPHEAQGFRYSFDMLGEAAMTAADALRYRRSYEQAIAAIGRAAQGRGPIEGPGISIKLSALHPRYVRAQHARVMDELYPVVLSLCEQARAQDIGLNIDAEEADRLAQSLDLLERLAFEPSLGGWPGLGFVAQAYQKRCPMVVDCLIDLARRSGRRLMVRLVKGAYWDSEIKRAQQDGQADFPVYTRKSHTDLAYLACARRLLAAPDAVYPQFATHNAHTLAAIYEMAGPDRYTAGQYEFQCLHGMGEPLYEQVVRPLQRPCRIYAPVGTHETLLAYLVRRLLENGANTSFVHRIADARVPIAELVRPPWEVVAQAAAEEGTLGLPHPAIALPDHLYGDERANSRGMDLADDGVLAALQDSLQVAASQPTSAEGEAVRNPADHADVVGHVRNADAAQVDAALARATQAAAAWAATPAAERAGLLERAAELLQADMPQLMALLMREAGKTAANAVSEVREAIDFLRYDARQLRTHLADAQGCEALGPVVCISPWNFPLAIFTGQVAAALAAGNPVLAKPAEQTPLVAARAVRALHAAGVPRDVLQWLPGHGEDVGAALVGDARTCGVLFTGSTEVARILQRTLADRTDESGNPVVLVAETGGQNAMVVDSSALPEQVVADVLASAFDSAGQRCSALRVLCLQEDIADRVLAMLLGAVAQLRVGKPDRLAIDVGPVIDADARAGIEAHIEAMRRRGRRVHQPCRIDPAVLRAGTYVPPTLVELDRITELQREVFGPVLHIVRWQRDGLDALMQDIAATGYALTLGVHSRIDETIARVLDAARAGNIYVNRNMIGAVVGVQPFGGEGLSGTGPKAGGPLYLYRLLARRPDDVLGRVFAAAGPLDLQGPTGEKNIYSVTPRRRILCLADDESDRRIQREAIAHLRTEALYASVADDWTQLAFDAVLLHGSPPRTIEVAQALARREGPIVPLVRLEPGDTAVPLERLVVERSVSINTAAAGGNATLMTLA